MSIFKIKKNKKFNYAPRYWDDNGKGSPFQIEQRFDKYRSTLGKNKNLKEKLTNAWEELRSDSDKKTNRRVLLIVFILVFLFLYLISFDLSIFTHL